MNVTQQIEACDVLASLHHSPCNDGKLVWRRWKGSHADDQVLVLLHGGFGSWLHWIRNIRVLSEHHVVLAVDLPGLGESAKPAEPITPESLGSIVANGLEQLAPDAVLHFVAFSFGGVVAAETALQLKHRVRSLNLVGASGMGLPRHSLELVRRFKDMSVQQRDAANLENLKRLMIANPDNIDELAAHIHQNNDRMARLKSRKMSFGNSLAQALPILGEHGVQLNGIWGENDVTAAPWIDERRLMLEKSCPNSRFNIIESAGHWVAYEAADKFNQLLLGYLGKDSPPT